jgi:hypothetical protein
MAEREDGEWLRKRLKGGREVRWDKLTRGEGRERDDSWEGNRREKEMRGSEEIGRGKREGASGYRRRNFPLLRWLIPAVGPLTRQLRKKKRGRREEPPVIRWTMTEMSSPSLIKTNNITSWPLFLDYSTECIDLLLFYPSFQACGEYRVGNS